MMDFVAARLTTLGLAMRQRGLTTVEYALAGGLIVILVVAGLKLIGTTTSASLNKIGSNIS